MRTKEELCYLVAATVIPYRGISHLTFRLQSQSKDCDFLEHRVNQFLKDRKDWQPTEEEFKKANLTLVNLLKTKDNMVKKEAQRNWSLIANSISDGNFNPNFDVNEIKIKALKTLTLESVVNTYKKIVNHEYGRLNIKIHSKEKFA
jgi:secreted Zn-dependent insulinase-like peptidase